MYHSEEVRRLAPGMDPLRLGMGWKLEDLEKPKVIIESTFGDSHPGSAHLLKFVDTAAAGVAAAGGRAARYFTTDICDGMAQGHDGINYSLASRRHDRQIWWRSTTTPLPSMPGYSSPAATRGCRAF